MSTQTKVITLMYYRRYVRKSGNKDIGIVISGTITMPIFA